MDTHKKETFTVIGDVYAVIEMYEYGSVDQKLYLEACAWVLKYYEQKYGKDDFRHQELFGHMQGDDWESTFPVRCLIHCEVIGCPHTTQEECEKGKTNIEVYAEDKCEKEYPDWKRRKCQHCSYLEGVKEKWEKKHSP